MMICSIKYLANFAWENNLLEIGLSIRMATKSINQMIEEMLEALTLKHEHSDKKSQLSQYVTYLLEGLKKVRLTGDKTAEGIIHNQIYDSLSLLKHYDISPGVAMLDLGSGGGLPGLPVKICKPHVRAFFMEANRKKALFLASTINRLNLKQAEVLCGRAEDYGQSLEHRGKYDLILCKAVAQAAVLAELTLPLLKVGGVVILYKGPQGAKEIEIAKNAFVTCGGRQEKCWQYKLENGEERLLYLIRKNNTTPPEYPRRAGKPSKYPIK